MQYVRYGLGKMSGWMHGYNPKLPTLYRKMKGMPSIEEGRMVFSTPENRFAYENGLGEDSPLITNFTSDVGVRRHADGNWNWAPTLAMPGESLLGKNVISTRPSDTFTFGDRITVPINKVTAITGRGKEREASLYPSLVGSWFGDQGRRRYIANPDEWINVIYDPYSPAEGLFRKSKGIDLKPEWQNK